MAFTHFRLATEAWMSGCNECKQVVAFALAEQDLVSAEQKHSCSGDRESLQSQSPKATA
jgi:hypothetical protein